MNLHVKVRQSAKLNPSMTCSYYLLNLTKMKTVISLCKNRRFRLTHFDAHKKNAYRPDMKTYTFKVSRHDSHKKVVAKVENVKGVKEAKWNPRTREVTVVYDANVTSVRNIKHFMA